MTRDLGDGAASIGALANGVDRAARLGLAAATRTATTDLAQAVRAGSRGGRLNAGSVGVRGRVSGSSARVEAIGPVRLMEDSVPAHRVAPRRAQALAGALRHPVAAQVRHPGHRARRVWSRGLSAAVRDAGPDFYRATSRGLRAEYGKG